MVNIPSLSWRRIKHDFLHHFAAPRVDLLAWILVSKLGPLYVSKLSNLQVDRSRYRDLPSWRRQFKKTWRELERRDTTSSDYDTYRPDYKRWVCTCPSFFKSRFLVCKHLVQLVQRVPTSFFLEVKRRRSTPFWVHPKLKPLVSEEDDDAQNSANRGPHQAQTDSADSYELGCGSGGGIDDDDEGAGNDDDEENEDDLEVQDIIISQKGKTYDELLDERIALLKSFTAGLEYQKQFRDYRFLQVLMREGGRFFRMAEGCMEKERRTNSSRLATPATWDQSTRNAMFYRTRPPSEV
jgi:hypothetical protein